MKKLLCFICLIVTCITFTGCFNTKDENTLIVGASSTPHADILRFVKEDFESFGYKLEIKVYSDYVLPNSALAAGDLDANFFQHLPYLLSFNKDNGTNLVSACAVHYEPMGIFGKNLTNLSSIPANTKIIIPADGTNQTRALLLLAQNGIITLKDGVNVSTGATPNDILNSNGHNVIAVEAATIPAQFNYSENGTIAVINGNYALSAGIAISTALAIESKDGESATTYANIIAVRAGDENRGAIQKLVELLTNEKTKQFITNNYSGAVLPI